MDTTDAIDTTNAIDAAGELDAAGALDLFPDAAVGTLRRFRPDSSAVRFAVRLAGRPGTVTRLAGGLAGGLAKVAAGRSTRPPRRPPRPAAPAASQIPRGPGTRCSDASFRLTWPSGGPPRNCSLTPSWTGGTTSASSSS